MTLYTLILKGGKPAVLEVSGNPSLEHTGGTSVSHLYLSEEGVSEIRWWCNQLGISVELNPFPTPSGSPEERRLLLKRPEEIQVPDPSCPSCPWYDPVTLGEGEVCFLRGAPEESVLTLLSNSDNHKTAAANCPVNSRSRHGNPNTNL